MTPTPATETVLLVLLFPCVFVLAFNRSFVGRWVLGLSLPSWLMQLFRCPLCLGFDFSLVWFLTTWAAGWVQLQWNTYLMLCFVSGVLCYIAEHAVLLIEAVKDRNEIETAHMLRQLDAYAQNKEDSNDHSESN